jgi:hypothetical protein
MPRRPASASGNASSTAAAAKSSRASPRAPHERAAAAPGPGRGRHAPAVRPPRRSRHRWSAKARAFSSFPRSRSSPWIRPRRWRRPLAGPGKLRPRGLRERHAGRAGTRGRAPARTWPERRAWPAWRGDRARRSGTPVSRRDLTHRAPRQRGAARLPRAAGGEGPRGTIFRGPAAASSCARRSRSAAPASPMPSATRESARRPIRARCSTRGRAARSRR